MAIAGNLGYPRLGVKRELKRALEAYWSGKSTAQELLEAGRQLRLVHWRLQRSAGIEVIPSHDFSFYDHVLDTTFIVGAVPERYLQLGDPTSLDTYFAMARGIQKDGIDIPPMEMTKWFDTNYHYIVPEIAKGQTFRFASTRVVDEFLEAKEAGIHTRPVLLGPVTYLLLSKSTHADADTRPLDALPALLNVYTEILERLATAGADWVQLDEPCLVLDLDRDAQAAYASAYTQLSTVANIKIMLATYFGAPDDNLPLVMGLPVDGLHVDLVRTPKQIELVLEQLPHDRVLSAGIIDGRNVWRTDLDAALEKLRLLVGTVGTERLQVAPSCSLLFSPHDLALETELDSDLRSWLAFARQKLDEIVLLTTALNNGVGALESEFSIRFRISREAIEHRRQSERVHNGKVRARLEGVDEAMMRRSTEHKARKEAQASKMPLPPLPTTTIGSFPQTDEVRHQRAARNKGAISQEQYDSFVEGEIARTIRLQEEIGLDVLVHGEFERTDMVEYFGEQLNGFAFTQHGWVQSYGSRGVRPPIIFGDVDRPVPMTVRWSVYAQSLTDRPVKGMLTGPVTILQWSFVRDDQPRSETCRQIALAIRDEVQDLEAAGIRVIQIDEPALREGLPLRKRDHGEYLRWAIECFRLASSGVRDETQVHTHMCYSEFNEIIEAIGAMDADVISIEASRSKMELLEAFTRYSYPNDIGPGVYDIHSPRVPQQAEIEALIGGIAGVFQVGQLWVNPDCGLKTRAWEEVVPSLTHMVAATKAVRHKLEAEGTL